MNPVMKQIHKPKHIKKTGRVMQTPPGGQAAGIGTTLAKHEVESILDGLNAELANLHNMYDNVTDPMLIDGFIYEIKATHMKYQYYLKLRKEAGF